MRAFIAFVIAAAFASPALALDLPARKAGLWQLTMTFDKGGMPQQVIKQCIDAATDKKMNSVSGGMGREQCSKQDVRQVGGTIVVELGLQDGSDDDDLARGRERRFQQRLYGAGRFQAGGRPLHPRHAAWRRDEDDACGQMAWRL